MDQSETVRSAEQLGFDLAEALQFSIADLRAFRRGVLPAASCHVLIGKVLAPVAKSAALTLVPLFALAFLISSSENCSLSQGLVMLFSNIGNGKEFAAAEGWFRTVLFAAVGVTLLAFGIYYATRIPIDLLGDIVVKKVRSFDGRVTSREEDKSAGKPDDVVDYYFEMRQCKFAVNRRAFLAIDSGGAYRVYYLPRSRTLVAIEPTVLVKEAEEKPK